MTKTGALMVSSIFRGTGVLCGESVHVSTGSIEHAGGNLHSLSGSGSARSVIGERGDNFVPRTQSAVGTHITY